MPTASDLERTAPLAHRLPPPIPNLRLAPAYQRPDAVAPTDATGNEAVAHHPAQPRSRGANRPTGRTTVRSTAIRACVFVVTLALIGASAVIATTIARSTTTDRGANPAYEPGDVPDTAATGASSTTDSQLARVEAIADSLPFDWRAAGTTFRVGCAPGRPTCHWGLYLAQQNTIWVGPGAFHSNTRLFYIVAHETAHAWQYANDPYARLDDMKDWRRTGAPGLEAAADCLAQVWGATTTYYWNCPTEARQHMHRVFVSTQ